MCKCPVDLRLYIFLSLDMKITSDLIRIFCLHESTGNESSRNLRIIVKHQAVSIIYALAGGLTT